MTDKRVSAIQKPRYAVLMIPVAWLFFSIWAVMSEAFPRYTLGEIPKTPPSDSEIFNLAIYAFGTVLLLTKILVSAKNQSRISAELKSAFALLLGSTIMATRAVFPAWQFLGYVGIAIVDIAAIIMLVTLLQGKRFGPLTLFHKDVQIQKISK